MSGLRAARELAGISQTELARRMAAKGFNWSQMTVSRREENENTLRWNEGIALRDIIGYPSIETDRTADYRTVIWAQINALQQELAALGADWVAS
ncbi:helix-turn-helix DNA binding domain protein [Microbacterium phage Footloose]|uniref:Helix-turn-helix DNA binding domain protein n=1 Tax=Microbacterium phage Footloose TaxID=2836048 RepID=A0A8F3E9G6_9CAUD|nr:helix-turn-helix DNA binding domain protein [Microbacterium phage Footloose]QWY84619.1 helix-turn-helix DNA binding domain protein [Microbacterium phage Footloose]